MVDLVRLVDAADVEALMFAVDGLCASRDWDGLVDLARRCRDAVESGKQLWPVAEHIDYRLAWEGPAAYAAAVLRPGAGRFALGPLTEVAASTHDWASLAGHLRDRVSAGAVAQERVIRGEDLTGRAEGVAVELPLRLQPWEPRYALPTYRARSATFPRPAPCPPSQPSSAQPDPHPPTAAPRPPSPQPDPHPPTAAPRPPSPQPDPHPPTAAPRPPSPQPDPHPPSAALATGGLPPVIELRPAPRLPDDAGVRALRDIVEAWVSQSSGRVEALAVEGSAAGAVGGLVAEAALLPVIPAEALALLQWAGASGGAYGRRRGGAAGRFAAWWAAAALTGLEWPLDSVGQGFADALGEGVAELHWFRWRAPQPETGWVLRLAVADPVDGLAWAVQAVDHRDDDVTS